MSIIQVLGPGCQKCQTLYERTRQAAQEIGLDCQVEKVTDIETIIALGVLTTPALVIDGKVKVTGRVPAIDELKELLA
jgi:small redox-active disulfide protein 2